MEPVKPNYQNRNTLGKIALKYCYDVRTLEDMITRYPALKKSVDDYFGETKSRGKKILPPIIVEEIFATLGEP